VITVLVVQYQNLCGPYGCSIIPQFYIPSVNFTNILRAAFAPKTFRPKITNPNCKLHKNVSYKKAPCKILVKLTPNLPYFGASLLYQTLVTLVTMDKLQNTGQNPGLVFNYRCGRASIKMSTSTSYKQPNLLLKTRPKQVLVSIPKAFAPYIWG
jgi:hypothetical protein